MINDAQFEVEVSNADALRFADVSGDWNPLHTDPAYAETTVYGRQVLHGAFSAGLISRLAGMYLPGKDCLLYGMKLRFVNPIFLPVKLWVSGKIIASSNDVARVQASVSDAVSGMIYVDGGYEFGTHRLAKVQEKIAEINTNINDDEIILVSGASGGLGNAVLRLLGTKAKGIKRNKISGRLDIANMKSGGYDPQRTKIAAIVHCAWPTPDNRRFSELENPELSIEQQIAGPIRDIQFLSSLIAKSGIKNAPLILIGSTFAEPGRHYFRMPLYSISKSTIPSIVNVLSLELASKGKRCYGIVFDVLDGGMNKGISQGTRLANADRSPWGELASPDEAAEQIVWLLNNQSKLISGSILTLSGGAIP